MNPRSLTSEPILRIVFAGTPDFAKAHLELLAASRHKVVGAYTQPDRGAGRGKKSRPSPVKQYALQQHIPVLQPTSLKDPAAQAELAALAADIMVVVAYGLLLPPAILDIPRLGCINVHASLLPRWRGAAPIERAIAAGDPQSGVTIMQMDKGLDTGPMLCQRACSIDGDMTGDQLRQRLAELGGAALLDTLQQVAIGDHKPEPQDDTLSSYAPKLGKIEAWIDWSRDAAAIARTVRAFCSANVSVSAIGEERIKIWMAHAESKPHPQVAGTILSAGKNGIEVACGSGILHITRLQLPGRKPLDASAILNARRAMFEPGTRLNKHG
jgi:methionyl-tRNA formyltransferase